MYIKWKIINKNKKSCNELNYHISRTKKMSSLIELCIKLKKENV